MKEQNDTRTRLIVVIVTFSMLGFSTLNLIGEAKGDEAHVKDIDPWGEPTSCTGNSDGKRICIWQDDNGWNYHITEYGTTYLVQEMLVKVFTDERIHDLTETSFESSDDTIRDRGSYIEVKNRVNNGYDRFTFTVIGMLSFEISEGSEGDTWTNTDIYIGASGINPETTYYDSNNDMISFTLGINWKKPDTPSGQTEMYKIWHDWSSSGRSITDPEWRLISYTTAGSNVYEFEGTLYTDDEFTSITEYSHESADWVKCKDSGATEYSDCPSANEPYVSISFYFRTAGAEDGVYFYTEGEVIFDITMAPENDDQEYVPEKTLVGKNEGTPSIVPFTLRRTSWSDSLGPSFSSGDGEGGYYMYQYGTMNTAIAEKPTRNSNTFDMLRNNWFVLKWVADASSTDEFYQGTIEAIGPGGSGGKITWFDGLSWDGTGDPLNYDFDDQDDATTDRVYYFSIDINGEGAYGIRHNDASSSNDILEFQGKVHNGWDGLRFKVMAEKVKFTLYEGCGSSYTTCTAISSSDLKVGANEENIDVDSSGTFEIDTIDLDGDGLSNGEEVTGFDIDSYYIELTSDDGLESYVSYNFYLPETSVAYDLNLRLKHFGSWTNDLDLDIKWNSGTKTSLSPLDVDSGTGDYWEIFEEVATFTPTTNYNQLTIYVEDDDFDPYFEMDWFELVKSSDRTVRMRKDAGDFSSVYDYYYGDASPTGESHTDESFVPTDPYLPDLLIELDSENSYEPNWYAFSEVIDAFMDAGIYLNYVWDEDDITDSSSTDLDTNADKKSHLASHRNSKYQDMYLHMMYVSEPKDSFADHWGGELIISEDTVDPDDEVLHSHTDDTGILIYKKEIDTEYTIDKTDLNNLGIYEKQYEAYPVLHEIGHALGLGNEFVDDHVGSDHYRQQVHLAYDYIFGGDESFTEDTSAPYYEYIDKRNEYNVMIFPAECRVMKDVHGNPTQEQDAWDDCMKRAYTGGSNFDENLGATSNLDGPRFSQESLIGPRVHQIERDFKNTDQGELESTFHPRNNGINFHHVVSTNAVTYSYNIYPRYNNLGTYVNEWDHGGSGESDIFYV